jgi:hypothetical protein
MISLQHEFFRSLELCSTMADREMCLQCNTQETKSFAHSMCVSFPLPLIHMERISKLEELESESFAYHKPEYIIHVF